MATNREGIKMMHAGGFTPSSLSRAMIESMNNQSTESYEILINNVKEYNLNVLRDPQTNRKLISGYVVFLWEFDPINRMGQINEHLRTVRNREVTLNLIDLHIRVKKVKVLKARRVPTAFNGYAIRLEFEV